MEFCDIFGKDRFFLELMDHRIPDQTKVNKGLMRIGKKTGLPCRYLVRSESSEWRRGAYHG
jgi:DNA polymerase III alpha subunit